MTSLSTSKLKLSLALLFSVLLFLSAWSAQAQEPTNEISEEEIDLSIPFDSELLIPRPSVELTGVISSSPESETIDVSATIQNLNADPLTDIRVGLEIVEMSSEETGIDEVVDVFVYPEPLSLTSEEQLDLLISHTPPANLDGEYLLFLKAYTRNGQFIYQTLIQPLTLEERPNSVEIQLNSCTYQLAGSDVNQEVTADLTFSPGQVANFTCTVFSQSESVYSGVTPVINSYWRSPYGDLAVSNTTDLDLELIANYDGVVEFQFEAPTTPNFYAANFELLAGDDSWQSGFFNYRVEGDYAYITTLQLMPEEFDTEGGLSILAGWQIISDDPNQLYALELEAEGDLSSCVGNGASVFSGESLGDAVNIILDNDCDSLPAGTLTAYLRDTNNNLLDERTLTIAEQEVEREEVPVVAEDERSDDPVLLVVGLTIATLLLMIIGVTLHKRRRHNLNNDISQDQEPLV